MFSVVEAVGRSLSFSRLNMLRRLPTLVRLRVVGRSFSAEAEKPVAPAPTDLEAQLTLKDKEITELKDLYIRSLADAQNVRTRTARELKEKSEYAITSFAKELLTTADILTMALDAVPENERGDKATHVELKNLYHGITMTKKELLKSFEKFGIVGYNPLGEPFDFNSHTAIFMSDVPDKAPGTVFHVDKVGYKIKDRVLRPANVGVVKDRD